MSLGNLFLRVQLVIARAPTGLSTMLVTGSLPALGQWQGARVMHEFGGQWVFDLCFDAAREPADAIEFDYQYKHLDKTGTQVWVSEVSHCRLQFRHILNHALDRHHRHHGDAKVVLYINGVGDMPDNTSLVATGSPSSLGKWNLRRAPVLSRHHGTGMQYTVFFVPRGACLSYACWLIRHAPATLQATPETLLALPPHEPSILWGSNVGILELGRREEACVVLLDRWDFCQDTKPPPPAADDVEVLRDRLSCKVCWEKDVECVFTSCGHACACWECSYKLGECPVCRNPGTERLRVYV
jgi:hypothetical protein